MVPYVTHSNTQINFFLFSEQLWHFVIGLLVQILQRFCLDIRTSWWILIVTCFGRWYWVFFHVSVDALTVPACVWIGILTVMIVTANKQGIHCEAYYTHMHWAYKHMVFFFLHLIHYSCYLVLNLVYIVMWMVVLYKNDFSATDRNSFLFFFTVAGNEYQIFLKYDWRTKNSLFSENFELSLGNSSIIHGWIQNGLDSIWT